MHTEDHVVALFAAANPVKDLDALDVIEPLDIDHLGQLARMGGGSVDVVLERTDSTSPPRPPRWLTLVDTGSPPNRPSGQRPWLVVTAAATIVALVAGGLWLARHDQPRTEVPAAEGAPDSPVEAAERIARGFLDALASHDADGMMTYLSDDAIAEMYEGPNHLRLEVAMDEAQNYQQMILGCEGQDGTQPAAGIRVRCAFELHAIRSEQMGFAPFTDNYWDLTVAGDKIIAGSETVAFNTNGFSPLVWEPFARWVSSTYPEDATAMYTGPTHTERQVSEASVQLWDRHSREYVDSRVGFVGLPPEGAISSNPATPYENVIHLNWCEPAYRVDDPCQELSIFPDGRVIWSFRGDLLEGANPLYTGFLEQRLTPQGIEYFTTEFAPLEVWPPPTYEGFIERLTDPSDWPSGTWADPEIRAYVPSTYEVSFSRMGSRMGEEVLALLPAAAQNLLRDRTWNENVNGSTYFWGSRSIPTDDIRTLVDILDEAGVEQDPEESAYGLQYRFDDPSSSATIYFGIGPEIPAHGH